MRLLVVDGMDRDSPRVMLVVGRVLHVLLVLGMLRVLAVLRMLMLRMVRRRRQALRGVRVMLDLTGSVRVGIDMHRGRRKTW
jgi:hypothetical protein